jgi:hypothetical protein
MFEARETAYALYRSAGDARGPRGWRPGSLPTSSICTAPALWPPDGAALDRDLDGFAVRSNRGEAGGPTEYSYEHLVAVARKRGA